MTTSKRSTSSKSAPFISPPPVTYVPVDTSDGKKREHIKPTTHTIPRSATSVGRTFSHIHPILLLAHFTQRFPSTVADPVPSLIRDLAVLGVAQAVYCVICLPPTTRATLRAGNEGEKEKEKEKASKKSTPARSKKKDDFGASLGGRVSTAILALLLTLFATTPVFFVLMVLLGAPLTTHHSETLVCAAHIAMLFGPPLFYTHGVQPRAWREVAALMLPGDTVWGGSLGAIVGSWLGAVPIPLDWDRDWQRWPVTIVAGAYGGWAIGRMLGEFVLRGKRVPMNAE